MNYEDGRLISIKLPIYLNKCLHVYFYSSKQRGEVDFFGRLLK